ncbi:MAG: DUF441 domain-containing protein [Firmicutes bacterium]|nr:DUF441 domain-containing protein [Bacillota bacterium]
MIQENLVLLVVFFLGLAFGNRLMAAASGALLVVKLLGLGSLLLLIERRALDGGLFFLLLAVLIPFGRGRVGVREIAAVFRHPPGIAAVIGGGLAAYLCGEGVLLLQARPEITIGLVVGTILGVALLRGVPVGPLAAAGLTAILLLLFGIGER